MTIKLYNKEETTQLSTMIFNKTFEGEIVRMMVLNEISLN